MLVFDIIIGVLLLVAVCDGVKEGILVQFGGLAGLLLGIWLAYRFGGRVALLLGIDPEISAVCGFIIVLVIVLIALALLARLLRKVARFAGLGIIDKLGGAVLSVAKVWLIVAMIVYGFDHLNRYTGWVEQQKLEQSHLYDPLRESVSMVFPFMKSLKNNLLFDREEDDGNSISAELLNVDKPGFNRDGQ